MQELICVYVKGNPALRMITNFRRTMIGNMPKLYYLDERPVQEIERAGIEAFKIGGKEAEMKARDEIAQKVHFANTGGHSVKRLTQQTTLLLCCLL